MCPGKATRMIQSMESSFSKEKFKRLSVFDLGKSTED